jgi:hypothetical protein
MTHQLRIAADQMRLAATRMNQPRSTLQGSDGVLRVDTISTPATKPAEFRYR